MNDIQKRLYPNEEKDEKSKKEQQIAAGLAAGAAVNHNAEQLSGQYTKPNKYTGNRKLYDSPSAKVNAKKDAFSSGKPVYDPYSKDELLLRKQDAKAKYGKNWDKHLAEADHVVPIKKVHERHKNDAWITNEDIRDAANSKENIKVVSREQNNAKRDRTNAEMYDDDQYLKDKDIHLSKRSRNKAIQDGKDADQAVEHKLQIAKVKNIGKAFHQSGMDAASGTAAFTGTMSAAHNIMAVIKGEKSPEKAIKDVTVETAKSAVISYGSSGALAVVSHTLSYSNSTFLRTLAKNNVPGKVLTVIMATGGTLKRYATGKINTVQCIEELGKTGVSTIVTGYSTAVGQVVIPIPVVGAAIGAMVGSAICGDLWKNLNDAIQGPKLAREERLRIEKECREARKQINDFRKQFHELSQAYLKDHQRVFTESLENAISALKLGDTDGYIHAMNKISIKLGGEAAFKNMEEFENMMLSDKDIVL